jgi:hypothetical protein
MVLRHLQESAYISNKFWEELIAYFPCYIENNASNNSSIIAGVFVTAVTFPPSHCLATIGGFLPSHCLAMISGFLPSHCLATVGGGDTQQCDLISLFFF